VYKIPFDSPRYTNIASTSFPDTLIIGAIGIKLWKLIFFMLFRSQLTKSKSNSIVPQTQQQAEAAKDRLKRLNDLVAREFRTSIDQTSSDEEDNDKVIEDV
jgi:hypothetical protein